MYIAYSMIYGNVYKLYLQVLIHSHIMWLHIIFLSEISKMFDGFITEYHRSRWGANVAEATARRWTSVRKAFAWQVIQGFVSQCKAMSYTTHIFMVETTQNKMVNMKNLLEFCPMQCIKLNLLMNYWKITLTSKWRKGNFGLRWKISMYMLRDGAWNITGV